MVLQAAWLPGIIQNASGNSGGILIGYMPIVSCHSTVTEVDHIFICQPEDPSDPKDRKASETLDFAQFKREIYQKVLAKVFQTTRGPSNHGVAVRCGDTTIRNVYPGIHIESLDGEEAAAFCCCRAALANYPCPKCLVHKAQLQEVTKSFTPRTVESMREVIQQAAVAQSKTATENILKEYGLHNIEVSICYMKLCLQF